METKHIECKPERSECCDARMIKDHICGHCGKKAKVRKCETCNPVKTN